jgi:hypothetical protein
MKKLLILGAGGSLAKHVTNKLKTEKDINLSLLKF